MDVYASVSLVVEKLCSLLIDEAIFLCEVSEKVKWVGEELTRMQSFLKDADEKQGDDERVKNWVREVRDAAYDAEDVIDTFVFKIDRNHRHIHYISNLKARHEVGMEIERIKQKLCDIRNSRSTYGIQLMEEAAIDPTSSIEKLREQRQSYPHLKETDIIGFRKDENILLERLIGGESRRCVISVVGMGGLGKTTLAQKVYNNDDVQKCFSYRAWVCVSQEYKLKDLLEKIAKIVMGLRKEELEKMDMDDLVEALSGFLRERRYLIVLDDIWEVQVWNGLKIAIPDTMNGSRVLFTTRDKNLALDADRRSTPIELHLLNEEESWKLFAKKALIEGSFEAATCPSELVQIGQAIVARCGGLPLAIVVLGSLLSIKDCDRRSWLRVLENVVWQLAQGSNCCLDILGLSYNDLPYNLKPCLLYLGLFPGDHEISVKTLIKLWVAEGFIQKRGQLTMEEVAEDCLEELIQRSLIQVVKRRHDGGPKTCRIHDLVRNLLISKAEQNLFFMIDGSRHTPPSLNLRRLAILYSEGTMSHDGSSSPSISSVHGSSTQTGTLTVVAFYPNGQPIGPNAANFSSSIGSVVRMYVPPNYTKWKEVPNELKEQVWKHICSLFDVPEYSRMWVLKKANDLWRDWKSTLCCGVCDKYQTNAERIAAIPKYVRKEDWQKFVEMCSMPEFIARRQLGKAARREMKNPHTSGRKGQARVADELRQQNPGEEITRTQVFLATHSRKDGTPLGQDTERITRMHARNPSLAQADLDNDPVALVCGLDTRGRVRGLGLGVSKSAVRHYTPFKRALEQKEASHKALETKVDDLSRKMKDVEHIIVSLYQSGTQGTSSQVRMPSTHQASSSNPTTAAATTQMSSTLYKLMHLTKRAHCVAYGRLMGESPEDEGCYRVIIDEILDGEVELQDGVSNLRDKILGDFIDWPKYRTFPC